MALPTSSGAPGMRIGLEVDGNNVHGCFEFMENFHIHII